MKLRQECKYCGNKSGKTDMWGGCITCGAQLEISENESEYVYYSGTPNGTMNPTHNYYYVEQVTPLSLLTPEQIRKLVRRSVGLE